MTSPDHIATSPKERLGLLFAVVLVAAATTIAAVALADWIGLGPVDDAYISLRYATHWASGQGLCFNPGERVEGYTNFLLVALEAAAVLLGIEAVSAMSLLGWLSLAALACLLFLFFRTHVVAGSTITAALLGCAASLNLSLVCWAASGMESCLYASLLFATLIAVLAPRRVHRTLWAACLLALAALTRPEAVALAPVFAAVVYLNRRCPSEALRFAALFAGLYGSYFLVRWAYFGYPFPNTFYSKLDYGNLALIERGIAYTGSFLLAALPLALAALAALGMARRSPLWVKGALLVAAAQIAVIVYEGGDHFAMFRFMVPVLPLLSVLAVYPIERLVSKRLGERRRLIVIASVALPLLVISDFTIGMAANRDGLGRNQLERFGYEVRAAREWSLIGRWLRDAAPPEATLATIAVGAIGFHSGLTIIDPHGVVDPAIAHLDVRLGKGYAGHEKFDVEYSLAKRPSYFLIQNWISGEPIPPQQLSRLVWGEFNRRILGERSFRERYHYEIVQLAPGAFIGLHVRRDLRLTHRGWLSCRRSRRGGTAPAASTKPIRAKRRVPRRRAGD